MSGLWKWTTIIGSAFVGISLSLMFLYMAGKSVVITEEHGKAGEETGAGRENASQQYLKYEEASPLQVQLQFGNLVQEKNIAVFHDMEQNAIVVLIEGNRTDASMPRRILADKRSVKAVSYRETKSGIELLLETDRRYQYTALWQEDSLQLTLTDMEKLYDYVVAVNPAHGGDNRGNEVNNLAEKEITLEVAKALEAIAREEAGKKHPSVGVLLMRETDRETSLEARSRFVNSGLPAFLVDLHVNADPANEKTFGTAVYYNDSVFPRYMTNAELAGVMEKELVTAISGKANGVFMDEEAKYPLLQDAYIPAVSVEAGYLTNHQEAALLREEEYQKRIAEGLYRALEAAAALLDSRK